MSVEALLPAGTVIGGDFTVVRPLDEGGMGLVYRVDQKSTGKQRALKVMHREIVADPRLQKRFEQEARVGAHIPSEHVVEVIAAGVDAGNGLPYLVMELLEGEDLRHRIDQGGPMSADDVRAVFEQLCHAMAAAHEAGVVHRDLKPENVFLARSRRAGAGRTTVKVLDFGIAKLAAESGTRSTKAAVGSPLWMAPEQTAPGPVTPAADVWALGLLAYEMLAGRPFWRAANEPGGTTAQLLREIVLDPIPAASARAAELRLASRLPAGFDEWFARCVAREPSDRFADAGLAWRAMQRMLAPADGMAETVADPSGRPPPPDPAETGAATPFLPAAPKTSEPPVRLSATPGAALPQETPVATVQRAAAPEPSRRTGRAAIALGVVIAVVGIGTGWALSSRAPRAPAATTAQTPTAPPPAPPAVASVAAAEPPAAVTTATATPQPTATAPAAPQPTMALAATHPAPAVPSRTPADGSATPRPAARSSLPGGFSDPLGPDGPPKPTQWKVQDHHIRLFSQLVSNGSNVADGVVRKAVEWDSWQYLRCYERSFSGAKDLADGVVTVGFDILDQLPRHAALVSSTFGSKSFNDCVVGTLLGQTINAAGPDGAGHVVVAFRFVPMN
jgi:serine/threonine protein kinase